LPRPCVVRIRGKVACLLQSLPTSHYIYLLTFLFLTPAYPDEPGPRSKMLLPVCRLSLRIICTEYQYMRKSCSRVASPPPGQGEDAPFERLFSGTEYVFSLPRWYH
jgi:hypothetical protein